MRTVQLAVVNCVSCERCQVETAPGISLEQKLIFLARGPGLGIHAMPSCKLTKLAGSFDCEVSILRGERRLNAKSITSVMMADLAPGRTFSIVANGPDEDAAVTQIASLLLHGFFEPICPDFERYIATQHGAVANTPIVEDNALSLLTAYAEDLRERGSCLRGMPCE